MPRLAVISHFQFEPKPHGKGARSDGLEQQRGREYAYYSSRARPLLFAELCHHVRSKYESLQVQVKFSFPTPHHIEAALVHALHFTLQ